MKFTLDTIEQSDVELPDGWLAKRNIFIGAELITVPDGNFSGDIGDVSYVEHSLIRMISFSLQDLCRLIRRLNLNVDINVKTELQII